MSIVGKSSQYYSGFSPTSIPGCALWLDAADSNTLTLSGSNVTAWRDKSGNGRNFTATVGNFTYVQDQGRQVVNIPNTTYMTSTVPLTVTAATSWIFFVTKLGTTNDAYLINFTPDGDEAIRYTYTGKYPVSPGPPGDANDIIGPLGTSYINGTRDIATVYTNYHQINGPVQTTRTTTSITISSPFGGRYYVGTLAEIIFYTGPITAPQRQSVEGYLATKWGLKSTIPATHPFKTLTPFTRPFVPVDISGCAVWLDGMDRASMDLSGTGVRQWRDKSGSGRHGIAGTHGPPTIGTTSTGLPAVIFNASLPTYFLLQDASTLSPTSASYFVQASATSLTGSVLSFWANSRILGSNYYWNMSTNFGLSPYTWLNSNTVMSIVENSASNCTVHWNGNLIGSQAYRPRTNAGYAASGTNQVVVGGHWSLGPAWTGNIQEIIMYDIAVTPGQRQQVETYLTNKWGTRGFAPAGHYARLAPALSTAFLPTQIAGCMLWLDGGDSSSMTFSSGTKMSQWRDKSGTDRHAIQANTALQPSWSNGVVALAGAQYMDMSNAFTMLTSGQRIHIFTVDKRGVNPSTHWILGFGGSGGTGIVFGYNGASSATNSVFSYSSAIISDTTVAIPAYLSSDPPRLWNGGQNGTVRELYLSGTKVASNAYTYTMTQWQSARIGQAVIAANAYYTGSIYEIIVFNQYLGSNERIQVEGYLANKWGLTSALPAGHAFKTLKP